MDNGPSAKKTWAFAGTLAAALFAFVGVTHAADPAQPTGTAAGTAPSATTSAATPRKRSPFRTQEVTHKAQQYYVAAWGVDKMRVSYTSSGNLIRFSYRVSDPERAKALADKGATPYLYGQRSRALLQVPVMDKVGALRQTARPEMGQEYWMVFSNKGNHVRPGDRVDVRIGAFHADGLMVE
jgi:hypothetical protein